MQLTLIGKRGAGKTTTGGILCGHHGFTPIELSKPVKDITNFLLTKEDAKAYKLLRNVLPALTEREAMVLFEKLKSYLLVHCPLDDIRSRYQYVTDSLRDLDPTCIVDYGIRIAPTNNVVFDGARYLLALQKLKHRGCYIVRVSTLDNVRLTRLRARGEEVTQEQERHGSETEFEKWTPDYIIDNNGTKEQLARRVSAMLTDFNLQS